MRAVVVALCSAIVLAALGQQQLWTVRYDNPDNSTGFGDVGLGISVQHDSMLVGRTYNNAPVLDLVRTDGSVLWSYNRPDTVFFEGGSCFLGNGSVLAYRCAMDGGLGLRVVGCSFSAPDPVWGYAFHGFEVDHLAGPVIGGEKAWLVAAGTMNGAASLHVMAFSGTAGAVAAATFSVPYPVMNIRAVFIPGQGLLVDAMLQHPSAFTAVPWEAMVDTGDPGITWSKYLTDTTGFLVNEPAITVPWAQDTLLTAITTWTSQLRMALRSASTGLPLAGTTGTGGITPRLADLLVVDGAIYVATANRFVTKYDAALHRVWSDTAFIQSPYPGMKMLKCPNGVVLVNGRKDGTTIGQDIEVTRFDGSTGTPATHFLFNDAVTNTHDLFQGAAVAGDTLFVFSAATFDTLNILNERTELSITAFLLDGPVQVQGQGPRSGQYPQAFITDRLEGVLPGLHAPVVLLDQWGRRLAQGAMAQLDRVFQRSPAGHYLVLAPDGTGVPVRVVRP